MRAFIILSLALLVAFHQLPGRRFFFILLWQTTHHSLGVTQSDLGHPSKKQVAHIQGAKKGMLQRFAALLMKVADNLAWVSEVFVPHFSYVDLVELIFASSSPQRSLYSFSRPPPLHSL